MNKKVECGDTAKCKVTQIGGVVVVRHDYLYGVARIGIQPAGSVGGKPHEIIHLDLPQAELIEKRTVSREGMVAKHNINLGDKGEDTVSGFEGVCIGIGEWLYSCTRVGLQPRGLQTDGQPIDACWFDDPQVTLIVAEEIKVGAKDTGGFGNPTSTRSSTCSVKGVS